MALKYSDVGEILRMIENSSCTEFNLETDDVKLQIRRGESRPTQKMTRVINLQKLLHR